MSRSANPPAAIDVRCGQPDRRRSPGRAFGQKRVLRLDALLLIEDKCLQPRDPCGQI